MSDDIPSTAKHFWRAHRAKVTVNRELRQPADGGSTRHVELDLSESGGLTYRTADNLAVLPLNEESTVIRLAEVMGFDLNSFVKIEPKTQSFKHPFPTPTTVKYILQAYCDLHE